jgi:hypothetical protein
MVIYSLNENYNIWLTTNNHLHLSDNLVNPDHQPHLNAYNIFDLAKLAESILLSKKIKVLTGYDYSYNNTFARLKGEGLIEIIHPQDLNYTDVAEEFSGSIEKMFDLRTAARIIAETIPIRYDLALYAISKVDMRSVLGPEPARLPIWAERNDIGISSMQKKYKVLPDSTALYDDIYAAGRSLDKVANKEALIDAIAATYIRAVFYYYVAANQGLNYYPDSIRTPLTVYINIKVKKDINKLAQKLVTDRERQATELSSSLNDFYGSFDTFEVEIPSCLTMLLARCKSRDEFVAKALELRDAKAVRMTREWLEQADKAFRTRDREEAAKLNKQYREAIKDERITKETLLVNAIPGLSIDTIFRPNTLTAPVATMVQYLILWNRQHRWVFLHNLDDQLEKIVSVSHELQRVFGQHLPNDQVHLFRKLRAYQNAYLSNLASGENTF